MRTSRTAASGDPPARLAPVLRLLDGEVDRLERRPDECPKRRIVVDQQEPQANPLSQSSLPVSAGAARPFRP